jgi:fructoselysine 6-kinase
LEGPNGRASLKIKNGERVFISSNQGGIAKSASMDFVFDDLEYLQAFSIVHTSAYSYLDPYLERLQLLNSLVSYDFSDDFDTRHALSLCRHIDIGFFSCAERSEEGTMDLLEKAVNQGCSMAVATRGPNDVILYEGRSWFRKAPLNLVPKDTLGAGDAFISGFLVSYVGSKVEDNGQQDLLIESSLEQAAAFAAEICQVQGAFSYGLSY